MEVEVEVRIANVVYVGGILGLFMSKDLKLRVAIKANLAGGDFHLTHVLPARPSLFTFAVSALLLLITFGFFTIEPGERLIFQHR